jgi:hypothetical protein
MKKIVFSFCVFFLFLFLYSCQDNTNQVGMSIMPNTDKIGVGVDTLLLNTSTYIPDSIYSNGSTYSLGKYNDPTYGATEGNILAELMCPAVNITIPSGAVPDSLNLIVYYNAHVCPSTNENARFDAYQMTNTLDYSTIYYSDIINPTAYTNTRQTLGSSKVFTHKDFVKADSTIVHDSVPFVKIQLSKSMAQRFLNGNLYASVSQFENYFKGVYLTSSSTTNTMITVDSISLVLKYEYKAAYLQNQDSTVYGSLSFPATLDVKQVNQISHTGLTSITTNKKPSNGLNKIANVGLSNVVSKKPNDMEYIYSPGGLFAGVDIPVGRIRQKQLKRIRAGLVTNPDSLTMAINAAQITFQALGSKTVSSSLPLPNCLLLIPQANVQTFFIQHQLPDAKTCFYATLDTVSQANSYTFDMTYFLQQKIRTTLKDTLEVDHMVLIPVTQVYSSATGTSTLTYMNNSMQISALAFWNKLYSSNPFKLNVMYNNFYNIKDKKSN